MLSRKYQFSPKITKSKSARLGVWTVILIMGVIIGTYIHVRLTHSTNKVKTFSSPTQGATEKWNDDTKELRIATYNIAHGRGGPYSASNWKGGDRRIKIERMQNVGHLMNDLKADVVVLNEVDFSAIWSGHVDQAAIIAQAGEYPYFAEQRTIDAAIPFVHWQVGNAVLSKYPIIKAEAIDFQPYSVFEDIVAGNHDAILVTIELPDGNQVHILGVHLEYRSADIRVLAARKILNLYQESAFPMFVVGDFNSTARDYPRFKPGTSGESAMSLLLGSGLFQTSPTGTPSITDYTYPSNDPKSVIDWILVPPPWILQEQNVVQSDLSDHLPVIATVLR
jgi:endonuclease/exonuclease/phosphatase family metal-dependent hydrolase